MPSAPFTTDGFVVGLIEPLSGDVPVEDPEVGRIREIGAIGDTDLRFKATFRLGILSGTSSDLFGRNPRPPSKGDKDEADDCESLCRLWP
jgi:hypothetical protein